jgi:hypothetical protein
MHAVLPCVVEFLVAAYAHRPDLRMPSRLLLSGEFNAFLSKMHDGASRLAATVASGL